MDTDRALHPAESLAFTTVRIECSLSNGGMSVGTGFFFAFPTAPPHIIPTIVTNKHVVAGAIATRLAFHRYSGSPRPAYGSVATFLLTPDEAVWLNHPDPAVDLCALPIAHLYQTAIDRRCELQFHILAASSIPTEAEYAALTALEDIIMVGYPIGLWDEANNMPLFRRGITATHPHLDYNGAREFLIDIACHAGSSGSPVLLYGDGLLLEPNTVRTGGFPRTQLLGVLYAYHQIEPHGRGTAVPIPTCQGTEPAIGIPAGIGYVIKAQRIMELQPALEEFQVRLRRQA